MDTLPYVETLMEPPDRDKHLDMKTHRTLPNEDMPMETEDEINETNGRNKEKK